MHCLEGGFYDHDLYAEDFQECRYGLVVALPPLGAKSDDVFQLSGTVVSILLTHRSINAFRNS